MTSCVAFDDVRREVGTSRDELIAQELPYGTSAAAFGLRAPSAPGSAAPGIAAMKQSFDAFPSPSAYRLHSAAAPKRISADTQLARRRPSPAWLAIAALVALLALLIWWLAR